MHCTRPERAFTVAPSIVVFLKFFPIQNPIASEAFIQGIPINGLRECVKSKKCKVVTIFCFEPSPDVKISIASLGQIFANNFDKLKKK